jgi:hypothetical protein
MSTVDVPDDVTSPTPAAVTAGEPTVTEPPANPDDCWQLEEARRDAYRLG